MWKGLFIIDPEIREELPRLDPSKLQTKAKNEKRKSKEEEDDMSSRSKRHRSKTSVKLRERERVGREELESDIGPRGDNAENGNDGDKSGNDVVDNVEDKSDNARVDNIEDESYNVGDKSENDNAEGAYVLEFLANADCNIEVDWEEFLDNHQEDIWNS
ncbi:hypothetical protein Adt_24092 [Abeliophyllum distichum]|uniref:Uncharacterized protein n=1 Tax=Abeliophyllum distichum TaxID=126358 RepID=A0ABD1SCQ8_9LAMI